MGRLELLLERWPKKMCFYWWVADLQLGYYLVASMELQKKHNFLYHTRQYEMDVDKFRQTRWQKKINGFDRPSYHVINQQFRQTSMKEERRGSGFKRKNY